MTGHDVNWLSIRMRERRRAHMGTGEMSVRMVCDIVLPLGTVRTYLRSLCSGNR